MLSGCIYSQYDVYLTGDLMTFRGCHAGSAGGGIRVSAGSLLVSSPITFENSTAMIGDAAAVYGDMKLRNVAFQGSTATSWAPGNVTVEDLSCWNATRCVFEGHAAFSASDAVCPRGTGFRTHDGSSGCSPCPDNTIRLSQDSGLTDQCLPCPDIPNATVECHATRLAIPAGWMARIPVVWITAQFSGVRDCQSSTVARAMAVKVDIFCAFRFSAKLQDGRV